MHYDIIKSLVDEDSFLIHDISMLLLLASMLSKITDSYDDDQAVLVLHHITLVYDIILKINSYKYGLNID